MTLLCLFHIHNDFFPSQITQYDPNEHVLIINNATVDDQGLYSVRISNEAGSVHSSAFVHVDKSRSLCDTIRRSFYDNVYDLW